MPGVATLEHQRGRGRAGDDALRLNFTVLFWAFALCSVVGLFGETVVSFFRDGHWESRAGFVFGPLSPIYGVAAVLMTLSCYSLRDKSPILIFLVAGFVGALFEYVAGWFFESAFGIVAWSYEGQPFNFHGHTSLAMACVWGLIGLAWMKLALPVVVRFVNCIPQRIRMPLTAACTMLVIADAALTLVCLDCWYLRLQGAPIDTPVQQFCATYFGDDFMQSRFETMSVWPVLANR